ncbi:MAG TPA: ribosomal protein S18-alanine N-acetyltransferase [Bacillota bacterium]
MCVEDLEGVLEIENASFTTPWSRNSFLHEILENERAVYLVAKDKLGMVCGYVGMWVIFDEGHITNLAVHPLYRNRGIGSMLLKQLVEACREYGVRFLTLEVRRSNLVAQKLYNKHGFVQMGVRRRYYLDNNEDALIMWKGPV